MLLGKTIVGAVGVSPAANTKWVSVFHPVTLGRLPKLEVFLDTLAASGSVRVRGLVYNASTLELLGEGDEVALAPALGAAWRTLPFVFENPGGVDLPDGDDVMLGVHVGDAGLTLYHDGAEGSGGSHNTDAYSDGAASVFGAATTDTFRLSLYADSFVPTDPVVLSGKASEVVIARLPFHQAQEALGATVPERTPLTATVSWHGSKLSPERGSFATAKLGGSFEQYVGRRLEIVYGLGRPARVRVYVNDIQDIVGDLSLARRAFAELAPLGLDSITATVKVLKEG